MAKKIAVVVVFEGESKESLGKFFTKVPQMVGVTPTVLGDFEGEDFDFYTKVAKVKAAVAAKPRKEVQTSFKFGA